MQDDTTNQSNPPVGGSIPGGMPPAPSEPTIPVGGSIPITPSMPGSEPTMPTPPPSMPGSEPTPGGDQGGSTPPPTPGI